MLRLFFREPLELAFISSYVRIQVRNIFSVQPILNAAALFEINSSDPALLGTYVDVAYLIAPSFCSQVQDRRRILLIAISLLIASSSESWPLAVTQKGLRTA